MPSRRARHRAWCFTWNNYPDQLEALNLDSLKADYLVYGKELGPQTGTPHLQGYVHFVHACSLSQVRRRLPGTRLVAASGTAEENFIYCSKDGDFVELGCRPMSPDDGGELEIDRWHTAWTLAKQGAIEDIDADIRVRLYTTLKRIGVDFMPKPAPLDATCGLWIYGLSGSGKTRAALSAYPDAYIKPRNNWWDGYANEPVVILDDVDKFDRALGGKLKHWADFAPFIAEVKGSASRIRPTKLIVTSQYKIEDIWEDEETRAALLRRFTVIEKVAGQDIILV